MRTIFSDMALVHRKAICVAFPLVFLFLSVSCHEPPKKALTAVKPPNVLFIAIDDLNDWVGCLEGHPQVETPNMDRLAARGTLFTNAHAQSPICNPSRTSVLTGKRPSTTGIYGLSPWIRDVPELRNLVTLPQYFARNGYTTYATGKVYHGNNGLRATDSEFDSLGPGAGVKKGPPHKLVGETPGGNNPWVDWGRFPLAEDDLQDHDVASYAVDVLRSKPQNPYWLSVGFFLPHVPLYAPEAFFDRYPLDSLLMPPYLENDREDTPRSSWYNHWEVPEPRWKWFREHRQDTLFVQAYLASISFMDQQLGRVLDALEESGQEENTIVVLWSDHGFHLGEKAISGKNTLWERATRVPLIFAGKGIGKGQKVAAPVELLDIYPTLNALCGFPELPQLEGHSLVPLLKDPSAKRPWPAITTNNYKNHAVRTEDWRFIQYANGDEELYHLAEDPNEWHNLSGRPDMAHWADSLRQWLPEHNALPQVGNYLRILELRDGVPVWQNKPIAPNAPIPGL
ncbi:sulfatase [Maribacter sp. 2307ULW6-5]|uniref:sulfatase n=1 Tax=Maribacter sp. 2307ULW6-5 TaxID=3386275 RepID=UPI0039BD8491